MRKGGLGRGSGSQGAQRAEARSSLSWFVSAAHCSAAAQPPAMGLFAPTGTGKASL